MTPPCPCHAGDCWRIGDTLADFGYDHGRGRHYHALGHTPPARPLPTRIEPPEPWPSAHDIAAVERIIEEGVAASFSHGYREAARRALAYRPLVARPNHT